MRNQQLSLDLFAVVLMLCAVPIQAQTLIVVNASPGRPSPIVTTDFATGTEVGSFVPTRALSTIFGAGVVVVGNEVFYTEFVPGCTSDVIGVAPFNGGAGGADIRTLPNPASDHMMRALAFANGILYVLSDNCSVIEIYGLNPTSGAVTLGPVHITTPTTLTPTSNAFAVLPNGNVLINDAGELCTIREYSTSGALIGNTITVPGCPAVFGMDTDGTSLFFSGGRDGVVQTDLAGNLITIGAGVSESFDISLVHRLTTPAYACVGFAAPFNTALSLKSKSNRAIPLQAQLFDGATLVGSATIGTAPPVMNVSFSVGSSPAADETTALASIGQASTGNQFAYDPTTGSWQFKLATSPYTASGTYTVTLQSGDTSKYLVSPQCTGRFVRQ